MFVQVIVNEILTCNHCHLLLKLLKSVELKDAPLTTLCLKTLILNNNCVKYDQILINGLGDMSLNGQTDGWMNRWMDRHNKVFSGSTIKLSNNKVSKEEIIWYT